MARGQRLVLVLAVALIGMIVAIGTPPRASAQAALPYVAFGSGLARGQVVEATIGGQSVGRTTADGAGRWKLQIEPAAAANGDTIAFSLDGTPTGKTVPFQSGHFTRPPGIQLGSPTAPAKPTPRAVPLPRPATRPTAGPCTRGGKPTTCVTGKAATSGVTPGVHP